MYNRQKHLTYIFLLPLYLIVLYTNGFAVDSRGKSVHGVDASDVLIGVLPKYQETNDQFHHANVPSVNPNSSPSPNSPFILHFIWLGTALIFCGIALLMIKNYQLTHTNLSQKNQQKAFTFPLNSRRSQLHISVQST